MTWKWSPSVRELLYGEVASVRAMRFTTLMMFLRATIVMAMAFAIYSVLAYTFGPLDEVRFRAAMGAVAIAILVSHALLLIRVRPYAGAVVYLAGLTVAIAVGETRHQDFWDVSIIFFVIPIVLSPAILPPFSAFVLWALVSMVTVGTSCLQGQGAQVNVFALVSLFFVSLIVFVTNTRAESVVRRAMADKDVLDQALDVVIQYETTVIEGYNDREWGEERSHS